MAIIGLTEYMRYLHLPSVVDTYMYTICSKITMAFNMFKRNLTCISFGRWTSNGYNIEYI